MAYESNSLERAREQFPITKNHIHMNIASGNTPPICVTQAMEKYFTNLQERGGDKLAAIAEVEVVRRKAARFLGCDASELAFTKNTSEGLNIAANSIAWREGDNIVVPADEHPNNLYPWLHLRRLGVEVRLVPFNGDSLDGDALRPYVDGRTRMVAIADVSFHPGQRNDLDSVAALCKEKGAYLVVDGVQAVGLLSVKLAESGIAMWSTSGHKGLLCPLGIGLFYCRKDLVKDLNPVYLARASIEPTWEDDHAVPSPDYLLRADARRFEIGNYNFSGTYAMGAALDLLLDVGIDVIERHVLGLAEYATMRLAERGVLRLGPTVPERQSSICTFNFPGAGWASYLAENKVLVTERRGALRVSMGIHNNKNDVDEFVSIVDKRLSR